MKYIETAKRIKEVMSEMNISQQELSNKSGVIKSSISHYVNGTHAPGNITAKKLADVLGVDPAWLMGFDTPKYPKNSSEAAEKDFELLDKYSKLSIKHQKVVLTLIDSLLEIQ